MKDDSSRRPVLLLIHGLIGSLDYFGPGARIRRAKIQFCDLLGYGVHRKVDLAGVSLAAQAAHVAAQIQSLDCGPVWVLGHSMGGAVAMLLADGWPELVAGVINVEGNFTLRDAFWSAKIAGQTLADWTGEFRRYRRDVVAFTEACGVPPTDRCVEWMTCILEHQPAGTVWCMSKTIVSETGDREYLRAVQRVVERGLDLHLVAGERSAADWDVPGFVRAAAASYTEQPGAGHLLMLEDPEVFGRTVDSILPVSA